MDTPQVDPDLLAEAAAPLRHGAVDAVVGPAADGGWWALGLRDPRAAAVIADVPTSRDDTGERTVAALRAAGLRVGLLPELIDVDTAADAVAVAREAPGTRFAAAVAALPAVAAPNVTSRATSRGSPGRCRTASSAVARDGADCPVRLARGVAA